MQSFVLESDRLALYEMDHADHAYIAQMTGDPQVMRAWEHAFSPTETSEWIDKQIARYRSDGYGYYLAVDKASGVPVGQAGLLREAFEGQDYPALGYMLMQAHRGKGYALEAARALMDHAFDRLGAELVITSIRPENSASLRVAEALGMCEMGQVIKHYRGQDVPHIVMGHRADSPRRGHAPTALAAMDKLCIPYSCIQHQPAYTMQDLEAIRPHIGDAVVVKNLFFETRGGQRRFLVLIAGDKRVRGADIAAQIGSTRLSFGSLSDMYRLLGAPLGALGALGLIFDKKLEVEVVVDRQLVECEKLSYHPLRNDQSVLISSADFFGKFLSFTSHVPVMVDIPNTAG